MNTASRIETKGERDRIHISKATADLLTLGGKAHWLTKRDDTVYAKGKGALETYWLSLDKGLTCSEMDVSTGRNGESFDSASL